MRLIVFVVFIYVFVKEALSNPLQEGCNQRYFQHYLAKGCEPVLGQAGSKCPIRFNCPQSIPKDTTDGCKFMGKTFKVGEDIPTGNPCQICSCRKMLEEEPPEFMCIGVECPSAFGFGRPLNDSCYDVYEKDKCCSTRTQCGETEQLLTCAYGGRTYFAGQQIYPDDDPCLVCTCGEGWTGDLKTNPNCKRLNCVLEERMSQLKKGCLPIYHEATCCPIEYYCGEMLPESNTPLATEVDIGSGNTCVFNGSHYRIGQELDIGHPTHCVTCRCTTPPEFTCVHQSCNYPSDEECEATYTSNTCCPTFDCPSRTAV